MITWVMYICPVHVCPTHHLQLIWSLVTGLLGWSRWGINDPTPFMCLPASHLFICMCIHSQLVKIRNPCSWSTNKVCIENWMALRGHGYSTISAWQPLRKLIWTTLTGPKCWAHTFSIHKNWVIPTPEDSDIHHRLKKASNSHRKHQNTKARTVPIYGRRWWVWNQMVIWDFLTVLRAQDSCWEQTWLRVLEFT